MRRRRRIQLRPLRLPLLHYFTRWAEVQLVIQAVVPFLLECPANRTNTIVVALVAPTTPSRKVETPWGPRCRDAHTHPLVLTVRLLCKPQSGCLGLLYPEGPPRPLAPVLCGSRAPTPSAVPDIMKLGTSVSGCMSGPQITPRLSSLGPGGHSVCCLLGSPEPRWRREGLMQRAPWQGAAALVGLSLEWPPIRAPGQSRAEGPAGRGLNGPLGVSLASSISCSVSSSQGGRKEAGAGPARGGALPAFLPARLPFQAQELSRRRSDPWGPPSAGSSWPGGRRSPLGIPPPAPGAQCRPPCRVRCPLLLPARAYPGS